MTKDILNKTLCIILIAFIATFSGCKSNDDGEAVIFNSSESSFIAQNNEFYYLSENNGISAVSKNNAEKFNLLRDPFQSGETMNCLIALCNNGLYYCDINSSEPSINKLLLSTLISENVFSTNKNYTGFLETSINNSFNSENLIYNFFTDGGTIYTRFHGKDGVFRLKNGEFERVIFDRIYNDQFSFNGKYSFYINSARELVRFDMTSRESKIIETNFANVVYFDGTRVLFSDKSGIFTLSPNTLQVEMLTDKTADELSSDGENIVFSKGNVLYCLKNGVIELKRFDNILNFAVISGTNTAIVKYFEDGEYKTELWELPI